MVPTFLNHLQSFFAFLGCDAKVDTQVDVDADLDQQVFGPNQIFFLLIYHEYSHLFGVSDKLLMSIVLFQILSLISSN